MQLNDVSTAGQGRCSVLEGDPSDLEAAIVGVEAERAEVDLVGVREPAEISDAIGGNARTLGRSDKKRFASTILFERLEEREAHKHWVTS
jgi:hypothetical protein